MSYLNLFPISDALINLWSGITVYHSEGSQISRYGGGENTPRSRVSTRGQRGRNDCGTCSCKSFFTSYDHRTRYASQRTRLPHWSSSRLPCSHTSCERSAAA